MLQNMEKKKKYRKKNIEKNNIKNIFNDTEQKYIYPGSSSNTNH